MGRRRPSLDLQSYLGSPLPVIGLAAREVDEIARTWSLTLRPLRVDEVEGIAGRLWKAGRFEDRLVAVRLLQARLGELGATGWRVVDRWVDEASGWGLVDDLAHRLVSPLTASDPRRWAELERWTGSRNPWRRRAAAYGVAGRLRAGELGPVLALLGRLRYDTDRWVQRAVGTWLREARKLRAAPVDAFLRRYARGLPRTVITVATERSPPRLRAELRARARPRLRPSRLRRARRGLAHR